MGAGEGVKAYLRVCRRRPEYPFVREGPAVRGRPERARERALGSQRGTRGI